MTATVTIEEATSDRIQKRVEMLNTEMKKEVYTVVKYLWNSKWNFAVNVQRDRKDGTSYWSQLNEQKHRRQFDRVVQIAEAAA